MKLRKERKAVKPKLTQARLADLAGVDQSTISKLENGHVLDPGVDTLHRLAIVLRRFGRKVDAIDLKPRKQPLLIRGALNGRRSA